MRNSTYTVIIIEYLTLNTYNIARFVKKYLKSLWGSPFSLSPCLVPADSYLLFLFCWEKSLAPNLCITNLFFAQKKRKNHELFSIFNTIPVSVSLSLIFFHCFFCLPESLPLACLPIQPLGQSHQLLLS